MRFPRLRMSAAVCCISVNDEVVHGIPGPRPLRPGDVVSIDTGCSVGGWCGDSAVTHPVGEVEADVQRLLDCTSGVLALAIELMASRNRWSDVATEMATLTRNQVLSQAGTAMLAQANSIPQMALTLLR